MKQGDIVRAAFQQNYGKLKQRPALVLSTIEPFQDLVLCSISGQLWITEHESYLNVKLTDNHPDFEQTGLKHASVFRLGMLYTMSQKHIEGKLGEVSDPLSQDFIDRIITHLKNSLDQDFIGLQDYKIWGSAGVKPIIPKST